MQAGTPAYRSPRAALNGGDPHPGRRVEGHQHQGQLDVPGLGAHRHGRRTRRARSRKAPTRRSGWPRCRTTTLAVLPRRQPILVSPTPRRYVLPLPPGHASRWKKYARLRRRVERELPLARLTEPVRRADRGISRARHRLRRGRRLSGEIRRSAFPGPPQMVERSRRSQRHASAPAAPAARAGAVNLAGGTHHAHATAARLLRVPMTRRWPRRRAGRGTRRTRRGDRLRRAPGDGTAAIARGDGDVFTRCSLHGAKNFPSARPSRTWTWTGDGTGTRTTGGWRSARPLFRRFDLTWRSYLAGAIPTPASRPAGPVKADCARATGWC